MYKMATPMTFRDLDDLGVPRHWTASQYREFKTQIANGQTKEKALEIVFGLQRTSIVVPKNPNIRVG
jgi:hypothetical protein